MSQLVISTVPANGLASNGARTSGVLFTYSSSNFISRRIQYDTFHTHNISTIPQMYSSGGCQRSSVAHRADNRYFNNDTTVGKQGARGNILFFPDVSSTLYSKYEWFNMSEYHIYLQSYDTTWSTSIWNHHNSKACTQDIIKFNEFIYMFQ